MEKNKYRFITKEEMSYLDNKIDIVSEDQAKEEKNSVDIMAGNQKESAIPKKRYDSFGKAYFN